jgi:hypothetical protein
VPAGGTPVIPAALVKKPHKTGDLQALSHSGTALRITYRKQNLEVTALSGEPDAIMALAITLHLVDSFRRSQVKGLTTTVR